MKRQYYKRLLWLGIFFGCLITVIVSTLAYYSYQKTLAINTRDNTSHRILRTLEELQEGINNMEWSSKSFLVTGNHSFYASYISALKEYNQHLAELKSINLTQPVEQMQMHTLSSLAGELSDVSANTIAMADSSKKAKAPSEKDLLHDKAAMDSMNYMTSFIETRERKNILDYDEQKAANARLVFILILVASLVAFVFYCILFLVIKRHSTKRIAAEDALTSLNHNLESTINERTAELRHSEHNLKQAEVAAKFGYWTINMDKKTLHISNGTAAIYGVDKNEFTEVEAKSYRLPEYNDRLNEAMRALVGDGIPFNQQFKIKRGNDGRIVDVHTTAEYHAATRTVFGVVKDITELKQVVNELRKSEGNLKQAEIASKFGYWTFDIDKKTTYSSDGASAIYGVDKNEFTDVEVKSFRLPEYHDKLNEAMRNLVEKGIPFNEQFKIKRGYDGAIIDIHSTAQYNSATRTVFGVIKDITAQKKAKEALRESEENLKRGEEIAKIGYWKMNLSDHKIYGSDNAVKIYGLESAHMSYEQIAQLRLPKYNQLMDDAFRQLITERKPFDVEYKIMRPCDGLIADIRLISEYSTGGDTIFGIVQDITARKNRQKEIDSERNLTESIFENLPGPCYVFTEEGKFIKWNKNSEIITGYSAEEINKKNAFDFFEEQDRERVMQSSAAVFENGFGVIEAGLLTKNQGILPYRFYGRLLTYNGQNCVLGIGFDISERKNAEHDLAESETKYKLMFYNNPMPMFMVNLLDYTFTDVNESAIAHYGYSREEFLKLTVRTLRPDWEREKFDKEIAPSQLHATNYLGKWHHVKKNGEIICVEIVTHEVKLPDGDYRLVLANDITERENALQKLQENIKELSDYKFALDESSIVAITDQRGIILHANDNFCKVSHYTEAELIGQDHRILNSGFHSKEFIKEMWTTIANGKIWSGEVKNKAKNGSYYWVDSTIIPFLNEQGKPYQYLSIRHDITNRKNAEEEIQLLHKKLLLTNTELNTTLNTLPANIALLDSHSTIIAVNESWKKFAKENKMAHEALGVGMNYIKVCDAATGDDEAIGHQMATSLRRVLSGEINEATLEYPCHSPVEKRWFSVEIRPFSNDDINGAVVMHVNITPRKEAEDAIAEMNNQLEAKVTERTAELTQANKALEAFSYSVSHDLRAPVRAIMGFSRIIKKEYSKDLSGELNEMFEHINSSSKRMNAIIDDMLTLAKYDKEKIKPVKFDLRKLFMSVWDNISFSSPHHAKLSLADLPEIEGDPSMMEQVVVNLISNAVKYSSKKDEPQVNIGFEKTETGITVYVKDNGAGFDMKNYHRLFGAFQRLHGSSEFEGTGVGLVLVKRIIEKHGGIVWADSNVNEGATFYFTLPFAHLNGNGQ